MDTTIFIYYHAFLVKEWKTILSEHLSLLENREIHLGVIGLQKQVSQLINLCLHFKVTPIIVFQTESYSAFELQTVHCLQKHAQLVDVNFLYLHTKGVYNSSACNHSWRRYMGNYLLPQLDYLNAFLSLSAYNTAGSLCYLEKNSTHIKNHRYFAGNFWMAKSSYLRSLPSVLDYAKPFMDSDACRYAAESWIGLGDLKPLMLDSREYHHPSELIRRVSFCR